MMLVASFTRSYREAQTYLTSVLLVPTLPIAFASIYSLKTHSSLMLVPSLSQHLLMTSVLKDEPIAPLDLASVGRLGARARCRAHRRDGAALAPRDHARLRRRLRPERRQLGVLPYRRFAAERV